MPLSGPTIVSDGSGIGAVLFDSTLGADALSIDTGAGGVAAGYRMLHIGVRAASSIAASSEQVRVTFNGDTSSVYQSLLVGMGGGGPTIGVVSGQVGGSVAPPSVLTVAGQSGTPAGYLSDYNCTIHGYADAYNKIMTFLGGYMATSTNQQMIWGWLQYISATAISRMKIDFSSGNSLKAGSRLTILGF